MQVEDFPQQNPMIHNPKYQGPQMNQNEDREMQQQNPMRQYIPQNNFIG